MDVIYTDPNKKELGILNEFELDVDVGKEKDFSLKVDIENNIMEIGSYFFIAGSEYGGVVDGRKIDTESSEIQYYGRNFRGILNSKIIIPPSGEDFKTVDGNVAESINELLVECELQDIFVARENDISLPEFQFTRYCTLYEGIKEWISSHDYNMLLEYDVSQRRIAISVEVARDFSEYLTYCTDNSIHFTVDEYSGGVNHLICLGSGNLAARRVIHLFTDEDGEIMPYSTLDEPQEDADYILDERNQVILGADENIAVYDYANAGSRENYLLLPSKPSDWDANYGGYFYLDENNKFTQPKASVVEKYNLLASAPYDWSYAFKNYYQKQDGMYVKVEPATVTSYEMQTAKPSDWDEAYKTYYKKDGSEYIRVSAVETEKYTAQAKKPKDWAKNYSIYYTKYSDGVTTTYKPVQGVAYYEYKKQTKKPTDWKTNFRSYYKKSGSEYVALTGEKAPTWAKKKYYTRITKYKAPKWSKEKRYTKIITQSIPTWQANKYYTSATRQEAATFVANTYYSYNKQTFAPTWYANTYYRKTYDNYFDLVSGGIKRLKELANRKSQMVKLQELDARIGDTVGGIENVTGIRIHEAVTNIIVKIKDGFLDVNYEVEGD